MRLQMLIVTVFAAAALASGCASWDARYRGNDYQCGSARPTVGHNGAFAGRPPASGCGEALETLALGRGMFESVPTAGHQRVDLDPAPAGAQFHKSSVAWREGRIAAPVT